MFNKNADFKLSSNGHYADNISPNVSNFHETKQILILEQCTSEAEKIKTLTKIHRQFGHASSDNIKRLLKNSNLLNCNTTCICQLANQIKSVTEND